MKSRISCRDGKCVDKNREHLTCAERYNNVLEIVECEEVERLISS